MGDNRWFIADRGGFSDLQLLRYLVINGARAGIQASAVASDYGVEPEKSAFAEKPVWPVCSNER